jgi:hypothetical protein
VHYADSTVNYPPITVADTFSPSIPEELLPDVQTDIIALNASNDTAHIRTAKEPQTALYSYTAL